MGTEKTKIIVLAICCLVCLYNVVFDFFVDDFWMAMPLHLCGLNAMVLPFAIATRNKTLNNLLLLWSLGALAAIVVNTSQAHFIVPSNTFIRYYFSHVFEFGIPILMFGWGLVKKDYKCIKSTIGITIIVYTLVHHYNFLVTKYTEFNPNFMYSMQPANPVFDLFYKAIPYSYWYLFLVFPIAILYLLAMGINSLRLASVEACKDKAKVICNFSSASLRMFGTIPQVETVIFL